MIRHSVWVLTGWLALLLFAAPLPFGGVTPWAAATLQGAAFVALVLAAWALESPRHLRIASWPAAALAGIALLGLLQSLPWPVSLTGLLSPGHAADWRQAAEIPGLTEEVRGAPLSLAPGASRAAALTWAAAAAVLLAGAVIGQRRKHRRWLLAALLAGALFQIFFGAQQWFSRSITLWGVPIPRSPRLSGTFVNPNHLALYLEMALPAAFAWVWWALRRARASQAERKILLLAPPILVWLTLFLGLAFTGSRGGLLGVVIGVGAQALALAAVRRRWRTALLGFGAVAAGLAVVAAVGLRQGLGRVLTTSLDEVSSGFRVREYWAVLDLWRQFPLFGTGLGTFRDAFPRVQPADLQGTWWHAHSDLLELLATTGLVGGLLLAAGFALVPRRLLRVLAGRGRSENRAAALALLGILAAVVVHEMVDSGLTMPANALTLAVLLGAGLAIPLGAPRLVEAGRAEVEEEAEEPEEAPVLREVKPARRRRKRRR